MEEKPDDDEIPNYITELKTVIAKQENSSKQIIISRLKTYKQDPTIKELIFSNPIKTLSILLINHINLLTIYLFGGAL